MSSPCTLSWRIGVATYEPNASFAAFERFVANYDDVVDEVAFFEMQTHHLYFPLEVFTRRAGVLAERIRSLKAAGILSVGINVLCTIGHINEAWDALPPLPFQAMVGHDGAVSTSCACPNTQEFRAYVREKYRLMAAAGPDFVWVDDDIRMNNHGVRNGCFCPTCLEKWRERTGLAMDRETLVTALNDPARGDLRNAMVAMNADTLESLLADIRVAVAEVNPRIATGWMIAGSGQTHNSGQDISRWMTALGATKCRPGGGFYSDDRPLEMVHKALDCSRQMVGLPANLTDRQYELENFPYAALSKSPTTLVNECTLALAVGMNGVAMNALGWLDGRELDERRPLMEAVRGARQYWDRLVEATLGTESVGLWPAWRTDVKARQQLRPGEDWFTWDARYAVNRSEVLAEIGLPLSAVNSGDGVILTGRIPELFSDDELRKMLAGGVLMDSMALEVLTERGLGELTGVRVARQIDNGVREVYTDDPLNGAAAGWKRYASIEFWWNDRAAASVLDPTADGVRVLSSMENYADTLLGPCMTAYENTLGGRVVVTGYAPWMFLGSTAKRTQLQNVTDWLSGGRVPVRINETVKLIPFVRLTPDRSRGAVVLLNAGFDQIATATIDFRTPNAPVISLNSSGESLLLEGQPFDNGWRVVLRDIPAWSTITLLQK